MQKTIQKLAAALAFLAAGASPLAAAETIILDTTGTWDVARFTTADHQSGCGLWTTKPDSSGTLVLLLALPNRPVSFNLTNSSWSLAAGQEYPTTIRMGTTQYIDLVGKSTKPTQITYFMRNEREYKALAVGLFTGSYLSIPLPDKRIEASLSGNGRLMKSWDACTASLFAKNQ